MSNVSPNVDLSPESTRLTATLIVLGVIDQDDLAVLFKKYGVEVVRMVMLKGNRAFADVRGTDAGIQSAIDALDGTTLNLGRINLNWVKQTTIHGLVAPTTARHPIRGRLATFQPPRPVPLNRHWTPPKKRSPCIPCWLRRRTRTGHPLSMQISMRR